MTLAAVLCCAMATTMFTACGSDNEDITPIILPVIQPVQTPTYVQVQFQVKNKADMLKYLDIIVKCTDGEKTYVSDTLTEAMVNDSYVFFTNIFEAKLPAQFTITREVTVKEAYKETITELEELDYTNSIEFVYAILDADKQQIGSNAKSFFGSINGPTYNVSSFVTKLDGIFGRVYELNFDEDGFMSKRTQEIQE